MAIGHIAGHAAAAGGYDDRPRADGLGQAYRSCGDLLLVVVQAQVVGEAQTAALLDRAGDAVEHLDATHRMFADGGLAGEHDGVGFLVDGIGDIGDLRPGRHWIDDHRLQHMGGDDDALAVDGALANDAPLHPG